MVILEFYRVDKINEHTLEGLQSPAQSLHVRTLDRGWRKPTEALLLLHPHLTGLAWWPEEA